MQIKRWLLPVAGISLLAVACHSDPVAAAKRYATSGDGYAAQGKFAEALVQYRNAVQTNGKDGEIRLKLGDLQARTGDFTSAIANYVRAADLLPDSLEAQLKAAGVLIASGSFEDGKERADKALAINAKSVEALVLRGNALAGLKQYDEAITQMQAAVKVDPDGGVAYANMAAIQAARGNVAAAEQSFKKAIEVAPTQDYPRLALVNFYWIGRRLPEAESVLKEGIAAHPKSVPLNRGLAYFYTATKRLSEAEAPLKLIADETQDPSARLVLADYYQRTNRGPQALAILDGLAADKKTYGIAMARKGAILYVQGHKPEAYAAVETALKTEPKNEALLLTRSNLLFLDRRTEESLKVAQDALAANPSSASAAVAVGRAQATRGDWDAAIQAYLTALKSQPSMIPAQLALGEAYLNVGKPQEAVRTAESTIAIQPGNLVAVLIKSRALLAMNNAVGAEQVLRALPPAALTAPDVQAQIATLAVLKHDYPGGRKAFEAALAADPNNFDALNGLTRLDFAEKKEPAARARLDAALARRPDSAPLLVLAAQVSLTLHDKTNGEAYLKRAIQADPQTLQAYLMLGQLYASQNRLDEAIADFQKLADHRATLVAGHTAVGMMYELKHQLPDAKKAYEQALSADPNAGVAANNLAMIYVEMGGNLDVALKLAQTAKAKMPSVPEVSDTLGLVYYRKGLAPLAVTAFLDSVAKDPKNPGYQAHLGLAYSKSGEPEKARESLKKAFALGQTFPDADEARAELATLTNSRGD